MEAGGAGLAAGIGVDLGVEHEDPDRLARGHQAGDVLEADVEHRAVAADGQDRRAEPELVVGEVAPVEGLEELVMNRLVVGVCGFELGGAHGPEAVGHLAHLAFEDADRDRRRILKQVVGPRIGVGVVGIGRPPD